MRSLHKLARLLDLTLKREYKFLIPYAIRCYVQSQVSDEIFNALSKLNVNERTRGGAYERTIIASTRIKPNSERK